MPSALQEMIGRRKTIPHGSPDRKNVSKQIQKEIAAIKRLERHSKIQSIMADFKGLKRISGMRSQKKNKVHIQHGRLEWSRADRPPNDS